MTLEKLLRLQIDGKSVVTGENIKFSPDFRVSVHNLDAEIGGKKGVHVIIHAVNHDSGTLDLLVIGNQTYKIY